MSDLKEGNLSLEEAQAVLREACRTTAESGRKIDDSLKSVSKSMACGCQHGQPEAGGVVATWWTLPSNGQVYNYNRDLDLENRFTYHAPKPGQPEKYEELRGRAKELAYRIKHFCPPSGETSLALTKLEEVMFYSCAAIARHE
ncbi:MAG: Acb2/Tad1 domain-containing protein [Desulfuromonadaceae bacterium]